MQRSIRDWDRHGIKAGCEGPVFKQSWSLDLQGNPFFQNGFQIHDLFSPTSHPLEVDTLTAGDFPD
jgi:hypothetical protein